eukprot:3579283-Pleurochrysis_carterae.AAC.1
MDHDDDGVGADVPLSPEAAPADDPAVTGAELDGVPFSPPRDFKTPAPRRERKKTFIAAKAAGPSNLAAEKCHVMRQNAVPVSELTATRPT